MVSGYICSGSFPFSSVFGDCIWGQRACAARGCPVALLVSSVMPLQPLPDVSPREQNIKNATNITVRSLELFGCASRPPWNLHLPATNFSTCPYFLSSVARDILTMHNSELSSVFTPSQPFQARRIGFQLQRREGQHSCPALAADWGESLDESRRQAMGS